MRIRPAMQTRDKENTMKNPWIIKAGGELLANEKTQKKIVAALAELHKKTPIVFVHGGGPQIETELSKNKVPVSFYTEV